MLAMLAAACATVGQPERPQGSRRVVQEWDFEDPLSGVEPVPLGWFRAQHLEGERDRPGFPPWNVASITTARAKSGRRAVMLPTRGGNTSLMLAGGAAPALPDTDYLISAWVNTEGLVHARALVSAWLLDENLARIPGSAGRSTPTATNGQWMMVEADLRGHPRAAWIQIELLLLQPRSFEPTRSEHQVWPEDFSGAVYVDNIRVSQVPRIDIKSETPANIFIAPDEPELLLSVRDMTSEPIDVDVRVTDLEGREVRHARMAAPEGGRTFSWKPGLDRFGWYQGRLIVQSNGTILGDRLIRFAWTPPIAAWGGREGTRFGIAAEDLNAEQLVSLPQFLERIRAHSANVAVWPGAPTQGGSASPPGVVAATVETLLAMGLDVALVVTNIPDPLAHELRIDPNDPFPLLLAADDPWLAPLSKVMASFGERVRRWQLGRTASAAASGRPDLAKAMAAIRGKLRRIIPRPIVAIPWSLVEEPGPDVLHADALLIDWPPGISAESFPGAWRAADERTAHPDKTLHLTLPEAPRFTRQAVAIDLARRAVSGWAAGATRMLITGPWTPADGAPERLEPEPHAIVWRTASAFLSERRVLGTLASGPDSTVYIADGPNGGMLVGWHSGPNDKDAVIAGWLGEGTMTAWDPFGNSTPIEPDPLDGHVVRLGEMPTFVTGIDASLVLFRSGLAVDPPFLPARAERHRVEVVIRNPWPLGISGRLRIAEPASWTVSPRVIPFALGAGESTRVPLEVAFAPGEEAGRQNMIVEVDLTAERRYPLMRWPIPVDIGLPTVEMLPSYRTERSSDGRRSDLIVSLLITNTGTEPLTVSAFARAPGFRAFEAPVSGLAPGESVTRRFRFDDGGNLLRGRTVRVGLKETSGTGRLNRNLVIEER